MASILRYGEFDGQAADNPGQESPDSAGASRQSLRDETVGQILASLTQT